jgi:hypothetical protein
MLLKKVLTEPGSCISARKRRGGRIGFRWDCSRAEETLTEKNSEEKVKADVLMAQTV